MKGVGLGLLVFFGLIASGGKVITFDSSQSGKAPPGWTFAMTNQGGSPQWEIRKDQTAPASHYVLAQVSHDPGGECSPLAILNTMSLRDGDVSVRIKPVAGREERTGGLVWRYRDENNYYLARANALRKDVEIYKVEKGRLLPISLNGPRRLEASVRHEIPSNAWSILKVSFRGDRFQVYFDHRLVLQAQDRTFAEPGKVGLWTKADSVTYFDDFRVWPR
jgi:hypothetical protein